MWRLWWTKRHWGRLSPNTSVSPGNHSTKFSIVIITRDWHNRPVRRRSAEWTQLGFTTHYTNFDFKNVDEHFGMQLELLVTISTAHKSVYIFLHEVINLLCDLYKF
jgi:hypothetical protein